MEQRADRNAYFMPGLRLLRIEFVHFLVDTENGVGEFLVDVVIFRAGYFALTANIKADISFFQEEDIIEKIFSTAVVISADYS